MTRFKIWTSRKFLAVLPVIFFLQLETAHTRSSGSHNSVDAAAIKCILKTEPPSPCVRMTGYMLPDRFLQIFANMTEELKKSIIIGRLETLIPEDFARLPVPLFLMISLHNLKSISGSALAALLKNHPQDVAITVKIMEILNIGLFEEFFKKLEGVELSSETQDKIAKTLVKWLPDANSNWSYTRFRMMEKIGNPLLAHLPPYFLANLTNSEATKFLFHLRNWLWSNLPVDTWGGKSEASKRAWTDMMLRSSYPYNLSEWKETDGRRFRYLLEGATPDELKNLTAQQLQNTKLFERNLSKLQIRALFSAVYSNEVLTSANLTEKELLPVALYLSPENLLRFNVSSTDFRVLKPLFIEQIQFCSYATVKQLLESLIAQSVLSGRLENVEPETWANGIEQLGKFIYVLPTSAFEFYRMSPPSALVQSSIDSDKISARQARLLTGGHVLNLEKPDMMLGQQGLLRALSSSELVAAGTLPQNLLFHLLANLPSQMPLQAVAILQKVEKFIGHYLILEKILTNKNPNQFFEMLSSRTVASIVPNLENTKGFDKMIKGLPSNTLSVLLTVTRTKLTNENGLWTSDILLSHGPSLALLGLTCNDIYAMETVDFIYVIEEYNKIRKSSNKPFPKDLQHCSQMALMNYLEMKASLQDITFSQELLDYLEPAEIEAVDGYILANLPPQDIEKAIHSQTILEVIGQLSFPELLTATKEINPSIYAQLLLNKYAQKCRNVTTINALELFGLGNLVHFLPAIDILKINPVLFKLFMESIDDFKSKTICADSATRAAWYQIILKAFGEPFKWTAGVLTTLGDFLLVVPTDDLNSVPEESWRDAADTLAQQTSYHLTLEWPGKLHPIHFYQACVEFLQESETTDYVAAVRGIARWYLAAIQIQLNTVVNASELITKAQQLKKGKSERKMVIPTFPMEIEHPGNIVTVLEQDESEPPIRVKKPAAEMDLTTDQFDRTTVQVTTSEIAEDFEVLDVTVKSQTYTTMLEHSSTVTSRVFEINYAEGTTVLPPDEISMNTSNVTLGKNITEDVSIVQSTTTFSNNLTSDFPLVEELGELQVNIPTIGDTEFTTQNPLEIIQTIESSKLQEQNNIENNYLTEKKRVENDVITTVTQTETSTVSSMKIPNGVANGTLNSKVSEMKPGNSSVSLQEKVNMSLSISQNDFSLSSKRLKSENVQVKRQATLGNFNEHSSAGNEAQQSGDILREVIKTNNLTLQTQAPMEDTTASPETKVTTVLTDEREIIRSWPKVSCDAIRAAGFSAELALDTADIELMGREELEICVDALGSLKLDDKVQRKIWSLINKDNFLENLSDLGYLVEILEVDDVSKINLNLTSLYALDNLAILNEMVTDTHVLHEVGSHFVKSNPELRALTTETTVALGRIICEVLTVSSHKLHYLLGQSVFLHSSPMLGRLKDCPTHCLHKFAHLATKHTEYGALDTWTSDDVASLGVIPAGLKAEQWRQLSSTGYGNNPLVGLSPSAVRCIPPQIFKELDEDQLKSLPTLSAAVVSEEQLSHLSESQQIALARVQTEVPTLKQPAAENCTKPSIIPKNNAPLKDVNLLVIVVLAVISRFSAEVRFV